MRRGVAVCHPLDPGCNRGVRRPSSEARSLAGHRGPVGEVGPLLVRGPQGEDHMTTPPPFPSKACCSRPTASSTANSPTPPPPAGTAAPASRCGPLWSSASTGCWKPRRPVCRAPRARQAAPPALRRVGGDGLTGEGPLVPAESGVPLPPVRARAHVRPGTGLADRGRRPRPETDPLTVRHRLVSDSCFSGERAHARGGVPRHRRGRT